MTSTAPVPSSSARRVAAFVAVLARTAGREALTAGLTPYLALLIVSSVIFGGAGMHARDLTGFARSSVGFRLALLGAWLLISMPAARAILAARSAFYLRCLPVPAWTVAPVLTGFMVLVEAHWCWLWLVGEGPAGAGAIAVAIGAHALLVTRPSRPRELAIALALAALIAIPAPLALWNLAGWPLAVFAVWRAWASAPGRGSAEAWTVVRRGQPRAIALAAAHLVTLFRRHRPVLIRWVWLGGSSALCGVLAVRNNRLGGVAARTLWLTCLVPGFLFGVAGLIGPIARAAATANWMLLSCGVTPRLRRQAFTLALLPPALALGGAAGLLSALALSWFAWSAILALVLLAMLVSTCVVLVAATAGLAAIAGGEKDATALLIRMAVVAGLLMVATWRFQVPGLLATTGLVAALTGRRETARDDAHRSARIAQQGGD